MGDVRFSNLEAVGIEQWGLGGIPQTDTATDVAANILSNDANRAYAVVTLLSISGSGNVFIAQGKTAEVNKGQLLQEGVPRKFFGPQNVSAIVTATETAVVLSQSFDLGLPRPGTLA